MADDPQEMGMPPGANRRHPNAQEGYESGNASLPEPTDNPRFAALSEAEWRPLSGGQRVAHAEEIREAEERGYLRGWAARELDCLERHATVERRIDAAARAFYLLEADDVMHRGVGS